jgi:hypothetical protein
MTSQECRAKALECYRMAQKTVDHDTRRSLLNLAVQWRELAIQMDNVNVGSLANGLGGMHH